MIHFWNATECCLALLFKKDSVIKNRVINYSRDEVMVALKHNSTNVPISMSQEVHLQHELCDDCHDGGSGEITMTMMTMMPGSSNPKWIVIVLTLDHVFTIRTSSQIRCSTMHMTFHAKSKGASEYCCGIKKLPRAWTSGRGSSRQPYFC
jgi:hypothetical protein